MGEGVLLAGFCGIADDLLKRRQVIQVTFSPRGRDATDGEGPLLVMALDDLDEASVLQYTEVAAQISIGERAELLEIVEGQSLGVGDQRGQYAQPRPLMDHTVQAFVGEPTLGGRILSLHCEPRLP